MVGNFRALSPTARKFLQQSLPALRWRPHPPARVHLEQIRLPIVVAVIGPHHLRPDKLPQAKLQLRFGSNSAQSDGSKMLAVRHWVGWDSL